MTNQIDQNVVTDRNAGPVLEGVQVWQDSVPSFSAGPVPEGVLGGVLPPICVLPPSMDFVFVPEHFRKLASIQQVTEIRPHPNADRLLLATVEGWQVVISTAEQLKVGDLVVYFEIDSLLPTVDPWFPQGLLKEDSVKKNSAKKESQSKSIYYRIKTIKLRGEISQGLIIPLSAITKFVDLGIVVGDCNEDRNDVASSIGLDLTDLLGIKKYEAPIFSGKYSTDPAFLDNVSVRGFPTHLLDKTDEHRVQSALRLLERIQGLPFYSTIKQDGTSATFLIHPETREFLVCSRNQIRPAPTGTSLCPYWAIARKYLLEEKLQLLNATEGCLAIQGEICGPNVQNNLLQLAELEFYVFNVVDVRSRKKLPFHDMMAACEKMQLKTVPIEQVGDAFQFENVKQLLNQAKGLYAGTTNPREGLVFRALDQSVSFKVINNDYLMRGQDETLPALNPLQDYDKGAERNPSGLEPLERKNRKKTKKWHNKRRQKTLPKTDQV